MIRGSKSREAWLRSYRSQLLSRHYEYIQSGDVDNASRIVAKVEVLDYVSDMVLGIDLKSRPGDDKEVFL